MTNRQTALLAAAIFGQLDTEAELLATADRWTAWLDRADVRDFDQNLFAERPGRRLPSRRAGRSRDAPTDPEKT